MRIIKFNSEIYTYCPRTIFYSGNDYIESILKRNHKIFCEYLYRYHAFFYSFFFSTQRPECLKHNENIILRKDPTLENEKSELSQYSSRNILAAITDVERNSRVPCVKIILEEIPENSSEDKIYEIIFGFLNQIILINDEHSKYYSRGLPRIRYRKREINLSDEEKDEYKESITADLLADAISKDSTNCISELHIDNNFDIHLPQYPQIKIELAPLPKTLYLLLLLHPEGIILKDIYDYSFELIDIYRMVSGRQNPTVIKKILNGITDPTINPLHKNLSIIRKAFLSKLRTDIAEYYIPTQGRFCAHRVPLDSRKIELPELFLRELRERHLSLFVRLMQSS